MSDKRFSVSEAIEFGWKTVRENIGLYISIMIIIALFIIVPRIISKFLGHFIPILAGVISLIVAVISMVIYIALIKISLGLIDKGKSGITDLFSDISLFIKCFLGLILYGLIVKIGLILLVLPGVYFAVRFIFTPYIIFDRGYGPIAALKESYRITEDILWDMVIFSLFLLFINILGYITVIGILITLPVSTVATAFAYRRLLADTSEE